MHLSNLGRMVLLYDMAGWSLRWYTVPTKGNDTTTSTSSSAFDFVIESTVSFVRYIASLAPICGSLTNIFNKSKTITILASYCWMICGNWFTTMSVNW